MDNASVKKFISDMIVLSESLSGHLRRRETAFLATLPLLSSKGEILEIGSFKGKSTIILAKAAQTFCRQKIHACDPLSLQCSTDPDDAKADELPEIFYSNIKKHHVYEWIEFFQMKSDELASTWTKPLKILWIDGDHTYNGAVSDIMLFERHLSPGAIVCLHDVLHGFEGPVRAFSERILLSPYYGDCGICGSIGWGQFTPDRSVTENQWKTKFSLNKKLSRLMLMVIKKDNGFKINEHVRKLYKSLVPHGPINPVKWIEARNTRARQMK